MTPPRPDPGPPRFATFEDAPDWVSAADGREDCARRAHAAVTARHRGWRMRLDAVPKLPFADPEWMWAHRGALLCTHLNRLVRRLLVDGPHFAEEEVRFAWTNVWYVAPHEYVRARIARERWIAIDPWGRTYGIPFGEYGSGWKSGSVFPARG